MWSCELCYLKPSHIALRATYDPHNIYIFYTNGRSLLTIMYILISYPTLMLFFRKPNYKLRRKIEIDLSLNNYVNPNIVPYYRLLSRRLARIQVFFETWNKLKRKTKNRYTPWLHVQFSVSKMNIKASKTSKYNMYRYWNACSVG